jgi:hypothetical protein
MKASMLYRIAAGLLLLFAIGHTARFREADPSGVLMLCVRSFFYVHRVLRCDYSLSDTAAWVSAKQVAS